MSAPNSVSVRTSFTNQVGELAAVIAELRSAHAVQTVLSGVMRVQNQGLKMLMSFTSNDTGKLMCASLCTPS
jgi:hypothetical protein